MAGRQLSLPKLEGLANNPGNPVQTAQGRQGLVSHQGPLCAQRIQLGRCKRPSSSSLLQGLSIFKTSAGETEKIQ